MLVGQYVEIKPAFTMDDPEFHDEITHCSGWIREIFTDDVLVELRGTGAQHYVSRRRIKELH